MVYANLLEITLNIAKNNIGSLRLSIIVLLLGLPLSTAGLVFHNNVLTDISIAILVLQTLPMLMGGFVNFSFIDGSDMQTEPKQIRVILGDLGSIASIISIPLSVILFIIGGK